MASQLSSAHVNVLCYVNYLNILICLNPLVELCYVLTWTITIISHFQYIICPIQMFELYFYINHLCQFIILVACISWVSIYWVPGLVLVQNHSKQTICSSVEGKKGSVYNRIRAEGSNSSDRGYYSFSSADAIPGTFRPFVYLMYCCCVFSWFIF